LRDCRDITKRKQAEIQPQQQAERDRLLEAGFGNR